MLKQILKALTKPIVGLQPHDYQVKVTENDQFKRIEVKGLFTETSSIHFKR